MGAESKISWTNDTWNPWRGCIKVSPGCKNCYMYRDQKRYGRDPMKVVRAAPATFNSPLKKLKGPLVFTCSWSDWFIEEADEWRDEAWDIIRQTPHLTYQILTKRPGNISDRLPADWGDGWDNVWLGVSVESDDQRGRIISLSSIPAKVRFVSAEPLLDELNLRHRHLSTIDWLISGGESGPGYRTADPNWFRALRNQCKDYDIPFFFKQHGGTRKIDGEWGGRELDGKVYNEMPTRRANGTPHK